MRRQQKSRHFGHEIPLNSYSEIFNSPKQKELVKEKSKRIINNVLNNNNDKENVILEADIKLTKISNFIEEKNETKQSLSKVIEVVISPPSNPQDVQLYREEIIDFLQQKEEQLMAMKLIDPNFMKQQKFLIDKHRTELVDYIMRVAKYLKLKDETIFLTVEIMDSFLSSKVIPLRYAETLALTAIFVASKYEEIYPPSLEKIISRSHANREKMLEIEGIIFEQRKFNIIGNTTLHWLHISQDDSENLSNLPPEVYALAKFFLFSCLYYTMCYKHKPSQIAKASLLTAAKWLKIDQRELNIRNQDEEIIRIMKKISYITSTVIKDDHLYMSQIYKSSYKWIPSEQKQLE